MLSYHFSSVTCIYYPPPPAVLSLPLSSGKEGRIKPGGIVTSNSIVGLLKWEPTKKPSLSSQEKQKQQMTSKALMITI
jgi:hypothetical protein